MLHRKSVSSSDIESNPSNGTSSLSYIYYGKICRPDQVSGSSIFIGLCFASSFVLARRTTTSAIEVVSLGLATILLVAAAYLYMARLCQRDDQQVSDDHHDILHFSETLGAIALRAFALYTLYLAICSVSGPPVHFLGLVFSTLRALQVFSNLLLVTLQQHCCNSKLTILSVTILRPWLQPHCSRHPQHFWTPSLRPTTLQTSCT